MTRYPRAPITEAVIEVQFANEPLSMTAMKRLVARLRGAYPNSDLMSDFNLAVDVNGAGAAVARTELQRQWFRCVGKDPAEICNIMPTALVTARLAPYTGWDDLFARFSSNYEALRKNSAGFRSVSRIGSRFINRIDIPSQGSVTVDPRRYIGLFPSWEGIAFDRMQTFATRAQYTDQATNATVILNSMQVDPVLLNKASIVLDIDVFYEKDVPLKVEELLNSVNSFRDIKNRIFESLITDEARKIFS